MCSHLSLYKFGEHMGLLFVNHSTDQYSPLDFLLSCSTDLRSRLRRNKDSRDPKVSEEQEIEKSKVTHKIGNSISMDFSFITFINAGNAITCALLRKDQSMGVRKLFIPGAP